MIRREGPAEGFLGINVKLLGTSGAPCLLLTQAGLTKHIIEALGLCSSFSAAIGTPAETLPLPKDSSGAPASGTFNYAAVVGMLSTSAGIHSLILTLLCINVLGILSVPLFVMNWFSSVLTVISREPGTGV